MTDSLSEGAEAMRPSPSSLVWFNNLQTPFTGTIAKAANLIAIGIGGYGFAHGEPGAKKTLANCARLNPKRTLASTKSNELACLMARNRTPTFALNLPHNIPHIRVCLGGLCVSQDRIKTGPDA